MLRAQGAAAGAALALAASIAVFGPLSQNGGNEIARGLVDGHLRSLESQHLFDVASSDQHTVKPWFAGKLDVTPPVPDLTLKSFTLIGGRLDYIDGRAVAVVVYRRRSHIINLFVWPGSDKAPAKLQRLGFSLRHWTKGGLTFWAVSDINASELAEFQADFEEAG